MSQLLNAHLDFVENMLSTTQLKSLNPEFLELLLNTLEANLVKLDGNCKPFFLMEYQRYNIYHIFFIQDKYD